MRLYIVIFTCFICTSTVMAKGNPASSFDFFMGNITNPEYTAIDVDVQGMKVLSKKGWGRFAVLGFQTRKVVDENLVCPNIFSLRVGLNLQWERRGLQFYGGFQPGLLLHSDSENRAEAWVSGVKYWNIDKYKHVDISFHYSHRDEYTYGYGNLDFVLFKGYEHLFIGPHLELESNDRFWGGARISFRLDPMLIGIQGKFVILNDKQVETLEMAEEYDKDFVLASFSFGFWFSFYNDGS